MCVGWVRVRRCMHLQGLNNIAVTHSFDIWYIRMQVNMYHFFSVSINRFYTKISEYNLSAFICRLFHEDFSSASLQEKYFKNFSWQNLYIIVKARVSESDFFNNGYEFIYLSYNLHISINSIPWHRIPGFYQCWRFRSCFTQRQITAQITLICM